MKASWGESFSQLESSLQALKNSTTNLPASFVYAGQTLTLKDLIESFERLIKQHELVAVTDVDSALCLIHSPGVIAQFPNLINSVNSLISSSGAAPYSDQLVSYI